jgi:predicted N-formylglutamate amidohydrolase
VNAPSPFVVTCEHGGNRIPAAYRRHFEDRDALLDSHRGYDPGALVMAKALARALAAPLVASTTSRLLVDLNRSIGHPRLHSDATRGAHADVRARIVDRHYRPYRDKVDRAIERAIARYGRAIHVSSHSFTPVLDGVVRQADVGLLYDPCREGERELCARWKAALARLAPRLRVRLNYPYAGKGDGVTRMMRKRYAPRIYVGVELEVNQRVVAVGGPAWPALRAVLIESLRDATRSPLFAGRRSRTPPALASRARRAPAGGHD